MKIGLVGKFKNSIAVISSIIILVIVIFNLYLMKKDNLKTKPRIFGSTYMTMNNPYFLVLNESLREVIEANGDILITRDPAQSQKRQNEQIMEMIKEGINVIFINPVDFEEIGPALEALKKQNIAIFIVDTDVKDLSCPISLIESDNYKMGELIAKDMMKKCPNGGDIALLSHYNVHSTQVRLQGFMDTIKNEKKYKIVASASNSSEIEVAAKEMDNILHKVSNVDIVFGGNDPSAVGAMAAIEMNGLANKGILVYGMDGSPYAKQLIKKGYMEGTVAQHPLVMGRLAAHTAYDYLSGKKVSKKILVDVNLITKSNLNEFNLNEWQ